MINLSAELKELEQIIHNLKRYYELNLGRQVATEIAKLVGKIKYVRNLPIKCEPGFAYGLDPQPTVRVNSKLERVEE